MFRLILTATIFILTVTACTRRTASKTEGQMTFSDVGGNAQKNDPDMKAVNADFLARKYMLIKDLDFTNSLTSRLDGALGMQMLQHQMFFFNQRQIAFTDNMPDFCTMTAYTSMSGKSSDAKFPAGQEFSLSAVESTVVRGNEGADFQWIEFDLNIISPPQRLSVRCRNMTTTEEVLSHIGHVLSIQ